MAKKITVSLRCLPLKDMNTNMDQDPVSSAQWTIPNRPYADREARNILGVN